MRVDPFYVTNLAGSLNQTQASEQQLTAELSSGVRVNSLSDDPLAAGENVLLLNQMQQDDSFTQTLQPGAGAVAGGGFGAGQGGGAADAGDFAGHQRQQRHHERERSEVDLESDCRDSR